MRSVRIILHTEARDDGVFFLLVLSVVVVVIVVVVWIRSYPNVDAPHKNCYPISRTTFCATFAGVFDDADCL